LHTAGRGLVGLVDEESEEVAQLAKLPGFNVATAERLLQRVTLSELQTERAAAAAQALGMDT